MLFFLGKIKKTKAKILGVEYLNGNMFSLDQIDTSFTLFIDRDGVLNHEKFEDYILNWKEFQFYDTTIEALAILSPLFNKIILVTNQKGVGKGVMSVADLETIHFNMLQAINKGGGRIDQIFYCPDLDNDSYNRKPNPGMAFQATEKYPEIDLSKSIMIGNRISDMGFGRNAGMNTVFLSTTHPEIDFPHPLIDLRFENLLDFANQLKKITKS
jgi:histidinol-phosphate phosphatase family protein